MQVNKTEVKLIRAGQIVIVERNRGKRKNKIHTRGEDNRGKQDGTCTILKHRKA